MNKDKKEAIKSHLDSLGTMAEQKYFAISFPELVTFNDKQSVKDYLDGKLDMMRTRFIRQNNTSRTHELEENTLESFLA